MFRIDSAQLKQVPEDTIASQGCKLPIHVELTRQITSKNADNDVQIALAFSQPGSLVNEIPAHEMPESSLNSRINSRESHLPIKQLNLKN